MPFFRVPPEAQAIKRLKRGFPSICCVAVVGSGTLLAVRINLNSLRKQDLGFSSTNQNEKYKILSRHFVRTSCRTALAFLFPGQPADQTQHSAQFQRLRDKTWGLRLENYGILQCPQLTTHFVVIIALFFLWARVFCLLKPTCSHRILLRYTLHLCISVKLFSMMC